LIQTSNEQGDGTDVENAHILCFATVQFSSVIITAVMQVTTLTENHGTRPRSRYSWRSWIHVILAALL